MPETDEKKRKEVSVSASGPQKKRIKKRCSTEGCTHQAVKGGVCVRHGAKAKRCSNEGCTNVVVQGGVCIRHGAKVKRCSNEGCTNQVQNGGVCFRHGAKVKKFTRSDGNRCSFEGGCINRVGQRGGLCSNHSAHIGSAQPNGGQRGDVQEGRGKQNNESTVAVAKNCDSKEGGGENTSCWSEEESEGKDCQKIDC